MNLLNLGCGARFHPAWVNLDLVSRDRRVMAWDSRRGLPFTDGLFDAVYHAHLLEHLTSAEARLFMQECYRVLKPGAIIRVTVPDLEQVAREYLSNLDAAVGGDREAKENYEWILLEMYDQVARNEPGGEMVKFFDRDVIPNEDYVYARLGEEAKNMRGERARMGRRSIAWYALRGLPGVKPSRRLMSPLWRAATYLKVGKFRMSGEVHYRMYDRYSLAKLLEEHGFVGIERRTPFESAIPGWSSYGLEARGNVVLKPDSLSMEGARPVA